MKNPEQCKPQQLNQQKTMFHSIFLSSRTEKRFFGFQLMQGTFSIPVKWTWKANDRPTAIARKNGMRDRSSSWRKLISKRWYPRVGQCSFNRCKPTRCQSSPCRCKSFRSTSCRSYPCRCNKSKRCDLIRCLKNIRCCLRNRSYQCLSYGIYFCWNNRWLLNA